MNKIIAVIKNTKNFKHIIKTGSNIVNEFTFIFKEDGFKILNMDGGATTLYRVFFAKEDMKEYVWDEEFIISVGASDFDKFCQKGKHSDVLRLTVSERNVNLNFNRKDGQLVTSYNLKSVDHPDIPEDSKIIEMVNNCVPYITMKAGYMSELLDNISIIAELIKIRVSQSGLIFSSIGYVGDGKITISKKMMEKYDYEKMMEEFGYEEDITMYYSIPLLEKTNELIKTFPSVNLSIYDGCPIILTYDHEILSYVQIIIAPREPDEESIWDD
jgi:DNA polymerase III sliding clamp (beta) subunit (PCNA family)